MAHCHASAVSTASPGRNNSRFGIALKAARCSTGWWVGPSSPSSLSHVSSRRWRAVASGRTGGSMAGTIGKHHKCAAVRDRPTMQGNAVHSGRHAMFAHTIMDISAAVIVASKIRAQPWGDPVRSPTHQTNPAAKASVFWLATRVARFADQPLVFIENRLGKIFWHITAHGRVKHGRLCASAVLAMWHGHRRHGTRRRATVPLCRLNIKR